MILTRFLLNKNREQSDDFILNYRVKRKKRWTHTIERLLTVKDKPFFKIIVIIFLEEIYESIKNSFN